MASVNKLQAGAMPAHNNAGITSAKVAVSGQVLFKSDKGTVQ